MSISILNDKLYIPRLRKDSVPRPRLIGRLSRETIGRLTLVSAPAGFGKTTAISEWIPHSEHCVCWLSPDENDNDPIRFWSYFIAALQMLNSDIGQNTQSLLEAQGRQRNPLKPESFLTHLLNEIAEFPDDFIFVLDDYHLLTNLTIHEGIAFLIDHLPPQMHLIITCRADPPLPLARWRSRNELNELRADDLRFTASEIETFLNQIIGLSLTGEDIAALEARTEGWVVGLQLAALSMQGRNMAEQRNFISVFTGSHRYVLDYLMEEVFDRQPENIRNFLLQTSILNRLNGSLCDAVLMTPIEKKDPANHNSQATLENLERTNLFIIPLDEERQWYRYHNLFADVLRHRLQYEQPDMVPELHRRAAAWYEQNECLAEVMQHAFAARDYESAARTIEKFYGKVVNSGETTTLLNWLETLPVEMLRSRPRLSLAKAWSIVSQDRLDEAAVCVDDAENAIRQNKSSIEKAEMEELLGEAAAVRATIAVIRDDRPAIVENAHKALMYLPSQRQYLRGIINVNLVVAYCLSGELTEAHRAIREALRIARSLGNQTLLYFANFGVAGVERLEGHLGETAEALREAIRAATTFKGSYLPMACMAHRHLAEVLYEWNHPDRAIRHANISIELGQNWWIKDEVIKSYALLARAYFSRGNKADAANALRQAEDMSGEEHIPYFLGQVAVSSIRQWISAGHLKEALNWADKTQRMINSEGNPDYKDQYTWLTAARVLIAQNRFAEAAQILEPILISADARNITMMVIDVLVLQSLVLQAQDDTESALERLQRALALAEPQGYIRTFANEGEPMQALLKRVTGKSRSYAAKLLTVFSDLEVEESESLKPSSTPSEISGDSLVEPLSRRESELIPLLAGGLSNQEIGNKLYISVDTVKVHLKHIYGKLEVSSRTQAVARARELNLLE